MADSLQASVAHVVAKLLARRATPPEEIPVLMRTVEAALLDLFAPPPAIEEEAAEPVVETMPEPAPRRRRARVRIDTPEAVPETLPAPQPQPRLVRRAEVAQAPRHEEPAVLRAPQQSTLRGVVKWFDQRTRRGAVRLPGSSDDMPIEPTLLDDMGLTRLYKDQEIEAVLSDEATPRILRLSIPGGVWQVHPTGGVVRNRHHARPVVVEMKRESLRRVAARVEAEQLLGPTRAR